MPSYRPTTRTESALCELRLAPWRAPETRAPLLGSLSAVLSDFVPHRPMPIVPAQRTTPDVAARLRGR